MQRNWLCNSQGKKVEAAASSQTPTPTQPAEAPATQSPIVPLSPDTKYCAVCTPLGKLCPNEYPITLDWKEDLGKEEEEGKDHDKEEDNFSVCSDWDADLEEQNRKNQEIEDQKNNDRKTPQPSPKLRQLRPLLLNV